MSKALSVPLDSVVVVFTRDEANALLNVIRAGLPVLEERATKDRSNLFPMVDALVSVWNSRDALQDALRLREEEHVK